ncbi:deuterosome assembly protein 1 isoform X3 [Alligator sinensis]|uniref:Deuterosome assembly protein 1 n=1 Tax=Alligator sinensis TaxID=38654 RepID=A0A1U7RTG7_ALLSI|nr:deuterosome assembly protein 1 isoform X3 [Alligator sinensis]
MRKQLYSLMETEVQIASPCEAELQELMHQIDIMVSNKKVEWERKMRALEAKMDVRDQELAEAQSKLDQKGQEVGMLRQKLENLQKTKYEMVKNYEAQLQALKSQFSKLTHSYEKLQLHQLKQDRVQDKERGQENQEAPFEFSNLNQKLEKQTQNYQFQISSKKQKKDDTITSSQPRVEKDEFIIEKLKFTVNEIAINRNKLEEENLKFQQELKMYQKQCQNVEAGLSEMKNELQTRDALWKGVKMECQQLRKELLKIGENRNVQENQMNLQSACVQRVEDLENKKTELLALQHHQKSQQEDLNKIRDHLYLEEQSHSSEQKRMRTEISDLTKKLHQKEITIATISQKATLLERQLKMELEIKRKLLRAQQLLGLSYETIKPENTHLKETMENWESRRRMNIDLPNKENENYTTSIHQLESENERLQNKIKLQNDTETSLLPRLDTYEETEYTSQAQMEEKEERNYQNENEWQMKQTQTATAMFKTFRCFQNPSPTSHGQGDIIGSESSSSLPSHRLSSDQEQNLDGESPSPPMAYTSNVDKPFPGKERIDVLLSHIYSTEENPLSPPEMSFPTTAAEKFFEEEENRAKEFEELLSSHIEELQRHSENTLKKYAWLMHNRHV